jgi:uncharacterized protein (DUF58 family)
MPNRRNAVYFLLILVLVGAIFTGRTFFFNLAYAFFGLLVLSWLWSWAAIKGFHIGRTTRTRRAQVGKQLDEYFTIQNTGILPKFWLEVRDHSNLPGHRASTVIGPMLPGRAFRWDAYTTCVIRGEFTLGPMTLLSGDPFGFFQMTRHIPASSTILVYPMVVPIRDFVTPTGLLSGGDAQRQRAHFVTTNAAGIREYAPGDSFNRIHWPSTARRDRLLVKEFDLDPLADIWLFADLAAYAHFERPYTVDGREFFLPPSSAEYGIVIAASLASHFLVKERSLGFAAYNPNRTVLQPDRGSRQLTRILETLALARIESDLPFAQLVALDGHHLGRGTTALLITADPSDAWVREAALLARRGVRVVAALLDANSFGGSVRPAEDTRLLLESNGVITYIVRQGDDISAALSGARLPDTPYR